MLGNIRQNNGYRLNYRVKYLEKFIGVAFIALLTYCVNCLETFVTTKNNGYRVNYRVKFLKTFVTSKNNGYRVEYRVNSLETFAETKAIVFITASMTWKRL